MIFQTFARHFSAALLAIALCVLPARVHAAGGAYAVDDAEIGKPGECKIETWASVASNSDRNAVFSSACVVNIGLPVELGGRMQRARSGGEWTTSVGPNAKTVLVPIEPRGIGLAVQVGTTWNTATGRNNGGTINVPVSFQINDALRLNLNAGWQYDNVLLAHYATWGGGFDWRFVKWAALIGEVFGQAGPQRGSSTLTSPRGQLGVRVNPTSNIDLDLIWGHNITGENAHWLTLGVNMRF